MPRRKQDRPKRMKWDDSGEPCKEEDCGDDNMASSSQGSDCDAAEDEGGGEGGGGNVRKTPSPRSTSRGSAMSEEPRISPLMTTTIAYASPSPMARTSPMSPRTSSRGSPLVMPPGELLLKTSVIVNHIHESSARQHFNDQDCPLDFSVKKGCEDRHSNTAVGILNLSKVMDGLAPSLSTVDDRPLDLSVPRKRNSDSATPDGRKTPKVDAAAPLSPWGAHFPFRFTPSSSPTSSVEIPMWNGKVKNERISSTNSSSIPHHHHHHHHHHQSKTSPSPEPTATKALEKMTELTRMGGQESEVYHRMLSGGGRQSAWQSHWLSKGAEQARDVLKCVWCKQSFKSLAEMTAHMKEARHCGVNVSAPIAASSSSANKVSGASPVSAVTSVVGTATAGSTSSSGASSTSEELNMLIKETMPLPRKLVRGQDVWLGKGAEQTKQILKCMWCGQSFKSLADMTTHMQQTQHYTNIISQEQIISWKSPEDKSSAQSHVNAVLTCKVCDQAFSSLKDLSNHMVKNSHYKEHILRSITESGGRRRQTREKRKKSLPVRKLLELERAQHEVHKSPTNHDGYHHRKSVTKETATVTCEKCAEKIETAAFVEHVRQCVGSGSGSSRNLLKSALMSSEGEGKDENAVRSQDEQSDGGAGGGSRANSVDSNQPRNSATTKRTSRRSRDSPESESEAPSVLNAIERLIEKSFDTRTRKSVVTSLGSSSTNILKRLGVEDSSHYTKPLMDNCSPLPPTATAGILSPNRPSSKDTSTSADGSLPRTSPIHDRGGGAKSTSPAPINSPDARATPCPGGNCCSPVPPAKGRESAASSPRSHAHSPLVKNNPRETPSPIDPVAEDDDAEKSTKKGHLETTTTSTTNADVERKSPAGSSSGSSTILDEPHVDDKNDVKSVDRGGGGVGLVSPRDSPDSLVSRSPCTSECSFTHQSQKVDPCPEDLSVKSRDSDKASTPSPTSPGAGSSGSSGGRFFSGGLLASSSSTGDHPLKELQKLLDKTDAHMTKASTSTGSSGGASATSTSTSSHHQGSPGAILAFSWACNDAVMTDSIMKCAFCDTPFISKGAYRHHLSKMHFVKDGSLPDGTAIKVPQHSKSVSNNSSSGNNYNKTSSSSSGKTNNNNSNNNNNNNNISNTNNNNNNNNFDESPTSKFLKYTELAKQLSSKYV